MRKIETGRKELALSGCDKMELVYYVTVDETGGTEFTEPFEVYGVGVTAGREGALARGITTNADKIWRLTRMLAKHDVTPVGLGDVLQDLL